MTHRVSFSRKNTTAAIVEDKCFNCEIQKFELQSQNLKILFWFKIKLIKSSLASDPKSYFSCQQMKRMPTARLLTAQSSPSSERGWRKISSRKFSEVQRDANKQGLKRCEFWSKMCSKYKKERCRKSRISERKKLDFLSETIQIKLLLPSVAIFWIFEHENSESQFFPLEQGSLSTSIPRLMKTFQRIKSISSRKPRFRKI